MNNGVLQRQLNTTTTTITTTAKTTTTTPATTTPALPEELVHIITDVLMIFFFVFVIFMFGYHCYLRRREDRRFRTKKRFNVYRFEWDVEWTKDDEDEQGSEWRIANGLPVTY